MIFETETGSCYEFDKPGMRVRRFVGNAPPTPRTGEGWKPCQGIIVVLGRPALIHWAEERCTVTSRVVDVRSPE